MDERLMAHCACGWQVVGTADEVVAATSEHAQRIHNMTATRDQILAQAVPFDAESEAGASQAGASASSEATA